MIVADGGDFVGTASYIVRPRRPLSWLDPGVFGTLGCGAGFALGASLCHPGEQVWILFGDGSVGYSLVEFDTFARHDIPVIAVVGNDAGWTQIAREQVPMLGTDVGTKLNRCAYHDVAQGYGAAGLLLDDPSRIDAVLDEGLSRLTFGRLAKRIGINDRSIVYYFPTKADLIAETGRPWERLPATTAGSRAGSPGR